MVNESAARFVHAAANEPTRTSTRWLEGIHDPNLVRLVMVRERGEASCGAWAAGGDRLHRRFSVTACAQKSTS